MRLCRNTAFVAIFVLFLSPGNPYARMLYGAPAVEPSPITEKQREFFEAKIRPVLVENCYQCHNSAQNAEGGLALDHRDGILTGGASGPAIVPGHANQSLLIQAILHQRSDLRMPKDGPKLDKSVVADLMSWISRGAPDPRDDPPSANSLASVTSWEAVRERRKGWWSFQSVAQYKPPDVERPEWSAHPVDRFVLSRLEQKALEPAAPADRRALIRRLSFVLTGLPPDPDQVDRFVSDPSPHAYKTVVDQFLESERYGEHWARHWMDWFRYAESHGSEGDPQIPYAWQYRDYLIRALNADVPYDQLVREHLAGDLLTNPRIDPVSGLNESAIGVAHFRFVQHGFAPTDALDEQVRFTDNQIDVVSKALLGLTVSCARCHNHKFDPISQKDYYALYGILASSRPAVITVDSPSRLNTNRDQLVVLKDEIRSELAKAWRSAAEQLPNQLLASPLPSPKKDEPKQGNGKTAKAKGAGKDSVDPVAHWQAAMDEAAATGERSPLYAWVRLRSTDSESLGSEWSTLYANWRKSLNALQRQREAPSARWWDLAGDDYRTWFRHGNGLPDRPSAPGTFSLLPEGEQIVGNVYPGGVYTHLISSKHSGVLNSPRFQVESNQIWLRVLGGNRARTRFVMQNYPRGRGTVYRAHDLNQDQFHWVQWNMNYWRGDHAHVEIATAADLPVEANHKATRSWFGITDVVLRDAGDDPPRNESAETTSPLFATAGKQGPDSLEALARVYGLTLKECIDAWTANSMTNEQASFLAYFVRQRLLPNDLATLRKLAPLVAEYRQAEEEVPVPTRAPGVLEGDAFDQPLFHRGNHKEPQDPVRRRFLEAIDDAPYETSSSGRLEFAQDLLRPENPLTKRVFVNRLWSHVFGRGIVRTTDNFGRLGEKPTHPELLDFLARRLSTHQWSMKTMVRFLVLSKTFQMSSTASVRSHEIDPDNRLLSHMSVRRLDAEALRDSMLAASRQLDLTMYGPSVGGGKPRRSVYVGIRRNSLDPFLSTFDAPPPVTTTGRRDITNVPAQSLTLMNDPLVIELTKQWAIAVERDPTLSDPGDRIRHMLRVSLGREPRPLEIPQAIEFIRSMEAKHEETESAKDFRPEWRDFAQAIFNLKEFLYVR